MSLYTLTERTYLTLDGRSTTNELEANTLLGTAGDEIPMEQATALGLVAAAEAPVPEMSAEPAEPAEPTKDEVMAAYARELRKLKADDVRAAAAAQGLSTEGNADAVRERLVEAHGAAYDAEHAAGATEDATGATEAAGAGAGGQDGENDPDVIDSGADAS